MNMEHYSGGPCIEAQSLILAELAKRSMTAPELAESTGLKLKYVRTLMRLLGDKVTIVGKRPFRKGERRISVYALPGTPKLVLPTYDLPKEEPRKRTHSGSGVIAGRMEIRGFVYPGGRSHRGGGL